MNIKENKKRVYVFIYEPSVNSGGLLVELAACTTPVSFPRRAIRKWNIELPAQEYTPETFVVCEVETCPHLKNRQCDDRPRAIRQHANARPRL
jgi:hypothetical protein